MPIINRQRLITFPENVLEMLVRWAHSPEKNLGWCLLCNKPIRALEDLLPLTNQHRCRTGNGDMAGIGATSR